MKPITLLSAADGAGASADAPALALGRSEVDLWCVALDRQSEQTLAALERTLSPDEHERARSFFFARDRRRFVAGRGALRSLLGAYLGCAPERVLFTYGPSGKPALAHDGRSLPLHFNLAHSEGLAIGAFTLAGEVGIDLEKLRDLPDWEQVAETVFPHRELVRLRARARCEQRDEFFRSWTRQEALVKAQGVGLAGSRLAHETGFSVHSFVPASGFVGAVAVPPAVQWATSDIWGHDDHAAPRRTSSQRFRLDRIPPHGPNLL